MQLWFAGSHATSPYLLLPGFCFCLDGMQRFVDAAVLAYECGMNEDSLRYELKLYKASLERQVAPPGMVSSSTAVQAAWKHQPVGCGHIRALQQCPVNM